MLGFRRVDGALLATFEEQEVSLLADLLDQLTELLSDASLGGWVDSPPDAREDVLGWLEWEMTCGAEMSEDRSDDPVLRRLFPDAYPDDPAASYDFRRFTQARQRDAKVDSCIIVSNDLRHASADGRCCFGDEHVTDWLTTMTNLRLAIAVRLGIVDAESSDRLAELPDEDPRTWLHSVYEWLGWVQESLLVCLDEDS